MFWLFLIKLKTFLLKVAIPFDSLIRLGKPFHSSTTRLKKTKIWNKVLCVIFPQVITCISVLTKYELI